MSEPDPINRPDDESASSDQWSDWPSCPQCGKRRQTFCPTCDLAGDDFPLAEYIPATEPIGDAGADAERDDAAAASQRGCCSGGSCDGSTSPPQAESRTQDPSATPADESEAVSGAGAEAALPILLFCPACSEAFSPTFYRLCAQCGYDFGEGREIEPPAPVEMNNRVVLALLVLAGLAVGLIAYFWMLFR